MKRKITEINKIQEKQVIQMKTITHHQTIDAQPVLSSDLPANFPLVYC